MSHSVVVFMLVATSIVTGEVFGSVEYTATQDSGHARRDGMLKAGLYESFVKPMREQHGTVVRFDSEKVNAYTTI